MSLRDLLGFSAGALSGHRLRTWLSLLVLVALVGWARAMLDRRAAA